MNVLADHDLRLQRATLASRGTFLGDCFGQMFFKPEDEAVDDIIARRLPDPPWSYTDDTVMTAGVLEVLRDRGAVGQDDLASIFAKRYLADPRRGYGGTAQGILRRISSGEDWRVVAPSVFSGMGSHGNGAAMRAAPIGAYFAHAEYLWLTVSGLGDRDTTCANVGGIVALALGENALPREWERHCERPPF